VESVKVVVLGGSAVGTPELASALGAIPNRQTDIELVLVGRNASKLALVAEATRLLAAGDPLLHISHTTDADAALDGADYVINQVRVGGLAARAFDESFPRKLGLPGEETVGAGGFANAARTIPVVLDYARKIEQRAPSALLLTFANPSSLVQYAVSRYTRVRAIGLCDTPVTLIEGIARSLHVAPGDLVLDYVGMHHFGWVTGLWLHGQDMLPQALAQAGDICKGIEPAIVQALGAIPCRYLAYLFHPERILARQQGKRTRGEELMGIEREILADYAQAAADGRKPTAQAKRGARWYEVIALALAALIEGRQRPASVAPARAILNVINGQTLPWLPAQAIIENAVLIAGGEIRPLAGAAAPPAVQAMIKHNCAYEMAAVEAIVAHDRKAALRALLLNPMLHSYDQAAAVLDQVWPA
jgi:6-phospho-beta-glucosidase